MKRRRKEQERSPTPAQRAALQQLILARAIRQLAPEWAGSLDDVGIIVPNNTAPQLGFEGGFIASFLPRDFAVDVLRLRAAKASGAQRARIASIVAILERGSGDAVHCASMVSGYEALHLVDPDELEKASMEPPGMSDLVQLCLFRESALDVIDEQLQQHHAVESHAFARMRAVISDKWDETSAILEAIAREELETFPDALEGRMVMVTLEALKRATLERALAAQAGLPPPGPELH